MQECANEPGLIDNMNLVNVIGKVQIPMVQHKSPARIIGSVTIDKIMNLCLRLLVLTSTTFSTRAFSFHLTICKREE